MVLQRANHPILDDFSLSLHRTRTNNYHPILDDSSHPKMDVVVYHPILDDSNHPKMDVIIYHPILDDPVIHFWMS